MIDKSLIEKKVSEIPLLEIRYINDKEIGLLSKVSCLRSEKLDEIKNKLGLKDLCVSYCPCEGYNPKGIILVGEF